MIDIIVVVFQAELSYLEIQAKSIDLYFNHTDVNNINIVVNDDIKLVDSIDINWYGHLSNKVKVIHYSELITKEEFNIWPREHECSGWHTQQICKVLAAGQVAVDWSMILDAKTWFVKNVDLSKIISSNNKAYSNKTPISTRFNEQKLFVEQHFNVFFDNHCVGPAGVPFIFHTSTIKSLIETTLPSFTRFFLKHSDPYVVTEFLLYSGYVLKTYGDYDRLYQSNPNSFYKFYNIADFQIGQFDAILANIYRNIKDVLTVSVSRKAYCLLADQQINQWLILLKNKGLINNVENTKIKLNTLYR